MRLLVSPYTKPVKSAASKLGFDPFYWINFRRDIGTWWPERLNELPDHGYRPLHDTAYGILCLDLEPNVPMALEDQCQAITDAKDRFYNMRVGNFGKPRFHDIHRADRSSLTQQAAYSDALDLEYNESAIVQKGDVCLVEMYDRGNFDPIATARDTMHRTRDAAYRQTNPIEIIVGVTPVHEIQGGPPLGSRVSFDRIESTVRECKRLGAWGCFLWSTYLNNADMYPAFVEEAKAAGVGPTEWGEHITIELMERLAALA